MISAKYKIISLDTTTGIESLKHEQSNLITNYGMNYFANGSKTKTTKSDWSLNNCGVWLKDIENPTKLLEELPLLYATDDTSQDFRTTFIFNDDTSPTLISNVRFDDGKECYIESTYEYKFRQGVIKGSVYGVYLGCANSYGPGAYLKDSNNKMYPWYYNPAGTDSHWVYDHIFSIFSAIKFKNEEGLETPITVEPIEQIFIRYTLRKYLPKYISPKTFEFTTDAGTSHTCKVEPRYFDTEFNGSYYSSNERNAFTKFSGYTENYNRAIVISPTNETLGNTSNSDRFYVSDAAYVNNSYKQSTNYTLNISGFNRPIKYMDYFNSMGSVRATFTPPIPKDNTLETYFNMSWSWGDKEDLKVDFIPLIVYNDNFETDLLGWDLDDASSLIWYEEEDTKGISLRVKNKIQNLSQTHDTSLLTLTNARITTQFKLKGNLGRLSNVKHEFLDEEGLVLATVTKATNNLAVNSFNNNLYTHVEVPVEGSLAKEIRTTFTLVTDNTDNSYITLTGIKISLSNMTVEVA